MYDLKNYKADLVLSARAQRLDDIAEAIGSDVQKLAKMKGAASKPWLARTLTTAFNRLALTGLYNTHSQTLTYVIAPATAARSVYTDVLADALRIEQLAEARLGAICTSPDINQQFEITTQRFPTKFGTVVREVVRVHLGAAALTTRPKITLVK